MSESIIENICKDDFYFINKQGVNWLVIKNSNGDYMYYNVDEIEKKDDYTAHRYNKQTGEYTAHRYDDKNAPAPITYGIENRNNNIGDCDNIPQDTEERPRPNTGKEKQGDLWCKQSVSYLCGKKTNAYKSRLKKGLGAVCRKKEHDCNFKDLPEGYSKDAENDGEYDPKFFTNDPSKKGISEKNITLCSKKTRMSPPS